MADKFRYSFDLTKKLEEQLQQGMLASGQQAVTSSSGMMSADPPAKELQEAEQSKYDPYSFIKDYKDMLFGMFGGEEEYNKVVAQQDAQLPKEQDPLKKVTEPYFKIIDVPQQPPVQVEQLEPDTESTQLAIRKATEQTLGIMQIQEYLDSIKKEKEQQEPVQKGLMAKPYDADRMKDINEPLGEGLVIQKDKSTELEDPTQDLLERIAIGEGAKPELLKLQDKHGIGTTQYDMVYGFGDYVVPSKPVSQMTMKELFDYQKDLINATKGKVPGTKYGTSAVGKYQLVKTSLFGKGGTAEKPGKNSWADKLGLKADTVFTPEIQEKLGMLVLKEAGYNSYIRGKKSEESFLNGIASKWASVEGSTANQHIATKKSDLRPILADIKSLITTRENTNVESSLRPRSRPKDDEFEVASN